MSILPQSFTFFRYWHDVTAYTIAKAHTLAKLPLPSKNSNLYSFPHDLEKPKNVFHVTLATTRPTVVKHEPRSAASHDCSNKNDEHESETSKKTNMFLIL